VEAAAARHFYSRAASAVSIAARSASTTFAVEIVRQ
jgi:hypothetical protein